MNRHKENDQPYIRKTIHIERTIREVVRLSVVSILQEDFGIYHEVDRTFLIPMVTTRNTTSNGVVVKEVEEQLDHMVKKPS